MTILSFSTIVVGGRNSSFRSPTWTTSSLCQAPQLPKLRDHANEAPEREIPSIVIEKWYVIYVGQCMRFRMFWSFLGRSTRRGATQVDSFLKDS